MAHQILGTSPRMTSGRIAANLSGVILGLVPRI
jgi:hypothetical protein